MCCAIILKDIILIDITCMDILTQWCTILVYRKYPAIVHTFITPCWAQIWGLQVIQETKAEVKNGGAVTILAVLAS